MPVDKIKSTLVKVLLVTLVATALVAVGLILFGSVADLLWRVIVTLIAGIVCVGILLLVLSAVPSINPNSSHARSSVFVVNSILALVCASYLTSILSIWTVISGDLPARIYLAFFVLFLGVLYAKPLINLEVTYPKIKPYIYANYVFIALTCLLTAGALVLPKEWNLWNSFYGRAVAASIVISITISMVITVMYFFNQSQKRSIQRANAAALQAKGDHAATVDPRQSQGLSAGAIIAIVFGIIFGLPIIIAVLMVVLGLVFSMSSFN